MLLENSRNEVPFVLYMEARNQGLCSVERFCLHILTLQDLH